jgi:hypothetical protein
LSILKDPKRVSQVKRHLAETESRIKALGLGDPQQLLRQDQQIQAEWPVQSPYW